MTPLSLVVLLSGEGSNLQALIEAIKTGRLNAVVRAVISDNPQAPGLQHSEKAHIQTHVINSQTRIERETRMQEVIAPHAPDFIVLAGYMRILSPAFIQLYPHRIINLHPSLLPQYKGLHTHERVLAAHETHHGSSVHIVTEQLDAGPILAQAKLTIDPHDTVLSLTARIKRLEHHLLPQTLQWLALRKITWEHNTLMWEGRPQTHPLDVPWK